MDMDVEHDHGFTRKAAARFIPEDPVIRPSAKAHGFLGRFEASPEGGEFCPGIATGRLPEER